MQPPLRLPVRAPPLVDESLTSLLRRNTLAMGYEGLPRLLGLIRTTRTIRCRLDQLTEPVVLKAIASLVGRSPEHLRQHTVHRFASALALVKQGQPVCTDCDTKTVLRYFDFVARRVCTECLAENPAYERLNWLVRAVPICGCHNCWLIANCPQCGRTLGQGRLDITRCRCGFDLRSVLPERASAAACEFCANIESWLALKKLPFENSSAPAIFAWLERLTTAILRTPAWLAQVREQLQVPDSADDAAVGWLAAAQILANWPDQLEAFLEAFQTVGKPTAMQTGTNRAFGRLLREAEQLDRYYFSVPADALRSYLVRRFTRGHLNAKLSLFRAQRHQPLVQQREWITRTQAARELRVRGVAIGKLVAGGLLTGHIMPAGRRTVGLLSRTSVDDLKRQLVDSLSLQQASHRLNIERHRLVELMRTGIVAGCVRSPRGWQIPQRALAPLEACVQQLPLRQAVDLRWITARQATRNYGPRGVTFAAIVQLILDGRVRAARDSRESAYRQLWIHPGDLRRNVHTLVENRDRMDGYPLCRLASTLVPDQPLKETVLRKWIAAGLLPAKRTAKRWWVQMEAIDRFRATYCLAREVCSELKIARSALTRLERDGQIRPVYGRRSHPGAGASVYLRADVERLKCEASAA